MDRGLSDSNEWQALLKKQLLDIADERILLADSSKFGIRTFAQIAPIMKVDQVISDKKLDSSICSRLEELGIEVVRV